MTLPSFADSCWLYNFMVNSHEVHQDIALLLKITYIHKLIPSLTVQFHAEHERGASR